MAPKPGLFDEAIDHLKPELRVRLLPPAEAQLDPHLHVLAQEIDGTPQLDREIVGINQRRELQLLHLAGRLFGLRVLVLLGLLVHELAVIHDPAHDGRCVGRDLHQVQALGHRQAQRIVEGHDAELLLRLVQHPHFAGTDLPVSAMQRFTGITRRKGAAQEGLPGWNLFMRL